MPRHLAVGSALTRFPDAEHRVHQHQIGLELLELGLDSWPGVRLLIAIHAHHQIEPLKLPRKSFSEAVHRLW